MSELLESLPPADPTVTCSRELRDRVLADFENYHAKRAQKRILRRVSVIATIGLIFSLAAYTTFHRLAPKMDPIHYVQDAQKVPHPGIPPKPPQIKPEPLEQPALQRHLPPRYPKYQQKLPKKVGGGNYELL
jgi:hypothetical protein